MNILKESAARLYFNALWREHGFMAAINETAERYGISRDYILDHFVTITKVED